jgi:hypothetical protein
MWVVLLFFLATGAIVWVFIWDYRRKTVKWEAASKERFDRIFMEQAVRPANVAARPAPAPVPPVTAPGKPMAVPLRAAERFLGQAETLVYYLLRAGMPDHAVFAKVPWESVIAAPGAGSAGGQPGERVAQHRLDFVVCDRSMRVAAVIQLRGPGVASTGDHSHFPAASLRAAGVRVIEINVADLPRREGIRKLVLGETPLGG